MERILIVDDERSICRLLDKILTAEGYACETALNAAAARECLRERGFDLILSDIDMPGESGIEFVQDALLSYPDTAAIMVTATDDPQTAAFVFQAGVYDYVTKPIEPNRIVTSVYNALQRRRLERAERDHSRLLEEKVAERTETLRRALHGAIRAMMLTVEIRDPYTAGHQRRVAELASAIARERGLNEERVTGIRMGGMIHDLGKLAIPAEILVKPSRLSENEFKLIQEHPRVGYDILKSIAFPWPLADMAHQHHERLDGSGYPRGLKGGEILEEARILGVADVVEAMASHRPYRPALGIDTALKELLDGRGVRYDSEVVDACLTLFNESRFHWEDVRT